MTLPRPRRVAALGIVLGVAFLAWLITLQIPGGVSDPAIKRFVSAAAFVVFGAFAVACAGAAARAGSGRRRTAWACVTIGAAGWVAAAISRSLDIVQHGDDIPFPSIADVGFLALPVATCLALLLLPVGHSGLSAARLLLDGLIVAGSLFLICWIVILRGLFVADRPSVFAFAVMLAYPILDMVVITVGVLVLIRATGPARLPVALLLAGVVLMAASNDVYFHIVDRSGYTRGDLLDGGWAGSMLIFGLAALASFRVGRADGGTPKVSLWLPYVPVAVAGGVIISDLFDPAAVVVLVGAVSLVIAVLLRQFLVVGQNQRLLAVVADQALRDPLTGLANRLLFADRLAHAVDLHKRELFGKLAVLTLDLDDFKMVNDGLGHAAGDALLADVATRIVASVRSSDTVARLGGDEFAILIEQGPERPEVVAQGVVEAFDEPFVVDGHVLFIRPSVGLSIAPARDLELRADVLLKQSDLAMYAAKRTRSAGVHTFAPDMGPLRPREPGSKRAAGGIDARDDRTDVELLAELRRAIDGGDLAMVYQPKVDLRAGGTVGVEALVRWPHPARGLLEPADFLPAVRRHGLMKGMTEQVFQKALADAAHWRDNGRDVPVAINLFAPSFDDFDLPARLRVALSEHGLTTTALTLEITEDLVLQDFRRTRTVIERLRDDGIRVSIDDFGSGYSGLQYLRELEIDEVKLDRHFILPILDDPRAASIVRAVVDLTHDLQVTCVAEGVESSEIADRLTEYGCDLAQGFHYSSPIAASALLDTLSNLDAMAVR